MKKIDFFTHNTSQLSVPLDAEYPQLSDSNLAPTRIRILFFHIRQYSYQYPYPKVRCCYRYSKSNYPYPNSKAGCL